MTKKMDFYFCLEDSSSSLPRNDPRDEKAREWNKARAQRGKIGCLAGERNSENCGYTLEEPLKGRLPARTIDYRNASHTQSHSQKQVKLG